MEQDADALAAGELGAEDAGVPLEGSAGDNQLLAGLKVQRFDAAIGVDFADLLADGAHHIFGHIHHLIAVGHEGFYPGKPAQVSGLLAGRIDMDEHVSGEVGALFWLAFLVTLHPNVRIVVIHPAGDEQLDDGVISFGFDAEHIPLIRGQVCSFVV